MRPAPGDDMNKPPPDTSTDMAKPDDDKTASHSRQPGTTGSRPIVGGPDSLKTEAEIERPIPVFLRIKPGN
jgi:hypothetical protein